ncbi:unnamed protein product [Merluccius merluccius]
MKRSPAERRRTAGPQSGSGGSSPAPPDAPLHAGLNDLINTANYYTSERNEDGGTMQQCYQQWVEGGGGRRGEEKKA